MLKWRKMSSIDWIPAVPREQQNFGAQFWYEPNAGLRQSVLQDGYFFNVYISNWSYAQTLF